MLYLCIGNIAYESYMTYTTGSSALPDIYAQVRGLQWYKCYVPQSVPMQADNPPI